MKNSDDCCFYLKTLNCRGAILLVLIGLFSLFYWNPCQLNGAATSKQSPITGENARPKGRPFHGTVKTVDFNANCIVLQGKAAQTFYVNSKTSIKIDGAVASFKDLTVGVYVGGYARQESDGRWVATTLNINTTKKEGSSKSK